MDAWLWAVRVYKTRSAATDACKGGHVRVNGRSVKPATTVKIGDTVDAFAERRRVLEVKAIVEKRVGAPVAVTCYVDHSPPAPVVKRQPPAPRRPVGMGRPTKRDRRELDRVLRRP